MDIENQASKTDIIDSESHLPPCKTRIPIGLYLIFTLVSISSFVYVIFTRPKVDDEWLKVTVCVVIFIWMGRCATWAFGFNGINSNLCYVTGLLFLSSWCLVMCLVGAVMIKMMGSRALYPTKFWTEELFLSNDVFATKCEKCCKLEVGSWSGPVANAFTSGGRFLAVGLVYLVLGGARSVYAFFRDVTTRNN
ncbi:hypothetical protein Fcan01_18011 [Folsomia candida]|uniref:Uncharacterized protein n=1 Tax=Folsomia candida TaxID=158441 RepID=A0A226DQB6_FOLCA|nr:hypothetical protein Fcan01_18011 [Folsomia candida]